MAQDKKYIEKHAPNIASVITKSKTPQPLVYMSDQHTFQETAGPSQRTSIGLSWLLLPAARRIYIIPWLHSLR